MTKITDSQILQGVPFPETVKKATNILIESFPKWLSYFESDGPFRSYGQLEYHRETIDRRRELGSASAAVTDERFQRSLYNTLRAWGIGARRSRLKPFDAFAEIFARQGEAVAELESAILDDPQLDVIATEEVVWRLQSQLTIVENDATLVPVTKTLHHVLPDLVVPIDRAYTQTFFGWQNSRFQYGQRNCFTEVRNVRPDRSRGESVPVPERRLELVSHESDRQRRGRAAEVADGSQRC